MNRQAAPLHHILHILKLADREALLYLGREEDRRTDITAAWRRYRDEHGGGRRGTARVRYPTPELTKKLSPAGQLLIAEAAEAQVAFDRAVAAYVERKTSEASDALVTAIAVRDAADQAVAL